MLDRVILQSSTPKILQITDVDPDEVLILKSISGLSGPKLTLFTGTFTGNGGYYQGRRADQRNPVFTFKMNEDYGNDVSISDIREMLYRWFLNPSQAGPGLQVILDDDRKPDRYFIAYTEDINTEMWDREQTAQVSTVCVDPFLKSLTPFHWDGFADMQNSLDLDYDGSADTGMEIQLYVATPVPFVQMRLRRGAEEQTMVLVNPAGNFIGDSIIQVNTTDGNRGITYAGNEVMAMLQNGSTWLTLQGGDAFDTSNPYTLEVWGSAFDDGKIKLASVGYRSSWWGI